MSKIIGFYTKNGRKIPISKRKPKSRYSSLAPSTKPHTISRKRTKQVLIFKKSSVHQKRPWEEGWKSPLGKTTNYSFSIVKKDGIVDYYIQVKHQNKEFFSIPLKPLIQRGISYGLTSITGFPVDVNVMTEIIQKVTTLNKLDELMNQV